MTESTSSGTPTVADMTAAYALDAVDHAKAAANVELDFSEESVPVLVGEYWTNAKSQRG